MVQAGTLPSRQLLLKAATPLLTAAQPCPKPADVKTFQLRKVKKKAKRRGFSSQQWWWLFYCYCIYYLLSYCTNQEEVCKQQDTNLNNDTNNHNINKHNMAIIQYKYKTGTGNKQNLWNFHDVLHKLSSMFSCMISKRKKNLLTFPSQIIEMATKYCLSNIQPNFTLFSEFMPRDENITFPWYLLLLIIYNIIMRW